MIALISRLLAARAESARHNDYDSECVRWYGDRSPARNRKGPWVWSGYKDVPITLRNMDGSPTMTIENRCPICNPYTDAEDAALLDFEEPEGAEWYGATLIRVTTPEITD